LGLSVRASGFLADKSDLGIDGIKYDNRLMIQSPLSVLDDVGSGAFNYSTVK